MGNIVCSKDSVNQDRSAMNEVKNKVILDKLIDYIDLLDDVIGDEESYINRNQFMSFALRFMNQILAEKVFKLLEIEETEKLLKYELYSVLILLCKGSFEAKTHTIFNLYCINEDTSLRSADFILLIKCVLNSVLKFSKVLPPSDLQYYEFLKVKCPLCLDEPDEFELDFEEFYDWVNGDEEIQHFLIENFDIQTRYHAMKSYLKYLSEFEKLFDRNVETTMDSKLLKNLHKKSKAKVNMPFSKDITDVEANLVSLKTYLDSIANYQ